MKPNGQFHTPSALPAELECTVPGEEDRGWDTASLDVCESNRDSSLVQKYPSQ